MARGNRTIDPELLPEARMERMREEMLRLRTTIISLVPQPYRKAVTPPYDLSQEESLRWDQIAAQRVIELTEPDAMDRAPCPLCGAVPNLSPNGFLYPGGLEQHLLGLRKSERCNVIHASIGIQRVRHREVWPGAYGMYGCD